MVNLDVRAVSKVLWHVTRLAPRVTRFPRLSSAEIQRRQLKSLQRMFRFAYEKIPFYRDRFDENGLHPSDLKSADDLTRFPLLSKDDLIREFPKRLLAPGTVLSSIIVSTTSGSSGKVAQIAYDQSTLAYYMLAGARTYHVAMGWRPWYRQFSVYTSPHPMRRLLSRYWLQFLPTTSSVEALARQLAASKSDFLTGYPSRLIEIVDKLKDLALAPPPLKAVFTNSEATTPQQRRDLSLFFQCPVFDEYSSEELNRIASQCAFGNYHVWEDLNFIEILDSRGKPVPEGELGEVVGTPLVNFTLPLLRYRQGDRARLISKKCPCGMETRILTDLQGRLNDDFYLPSGRKLSTGLLLDTAYSLILENEGAVSDYCLIQERRDLIRLEVRPGPGWKSHLAGQFEKRFSEIIEEPISFQLDCVSSLSRVDSGKRNSIVRRPEVQL